ncbi:MAG: class I SAM-dependent methyltransferase [Candidatus Aenigmarchaeota archaeon]|nr:class I SAM-dependent methyltransferase [Candidatus Aenigmarchaeota archaeon]
MAIMFRVRDFFKPRKAVLKEAGIKQGFCVLDYGCESGGYVTDASMMAGETGKIYAIDIHPLAIRMVENIASKKQLANVKTICSDCKTGLENSSIDVVIFYDTFHNLEEPDRVLKELHRLLKPKGTLSFSDHHMSERDIVSKVTNSGLFRLLNKGEKTYSFAKKK